MITFVAVKDGNDYHFTVDVSAGQDETIIDIAVEHNTPLDVYVDGSTVHIEASALLLAQLFDDLVINYSIGDDVDALFSVTRVGDVPIGINLIEYLADVRTKVDGIITVHVTYDSGGSIVQTQSYMYVVQAQNNWTGDKDALLYLMEHHDTSSD